MVGGGCGVQTSYRVTPTWDWIELNWVGSWVGLSQKCVMTVNFVAGPDVYKVSRQAKAAVDKRAKEYIDELRQVNAPTSAIANRLTNVLDVQLDKSDKKNVDVFLHEIKQGGGKVMAKYIEGSNKCRVLVIMTHYMLLDLSMSKPRVFVNDTTFNTNEEGFKVHFV